MSILFPDGESEAQAKSLSLWAFSQATQPNMTCQALLDGLVSAKAGEEGGGAKIEFLWPAVDEPIPALEGVRVGLNSFYVEAWDSEGQVLLRGCQEVEVGADHNELILELDYACLPSEEVCDGEDNDCDGRKDEAEDMVAPDCPLQQGLCEGTRSSLCLGSSGWASCGIEEYGLDYEVEETQCDGLDNDCDGEEDEGCECQEGQSRLCALTEGVCAQAEQTCNSRGLWNACQYGSFYEAEEASCDNRDNDCDGDVDEDCDCLPGSNEPCPLTQGVCQYTLHTCGPDGLWLDCEYGDDYEAAIEVSCDGLDNDCDGEADEEDICLSCIEGETRPCPLHQGVCEGVLQECGGEGTWLACDYGLAYEVEETQCDGLDNDCDGSTDEMDPILCELNQGVCAGKRQECLGVEGWQDCSPEDFGPSYEEEEVSCDGRDNDCDGEVDEMEHGPLCENQEGLCQGSTARVCVGSQGWLPCSSRNEYGPYYESFETLCDGMDNDCDGRVDEDCPECHVSDPPQRCPYWVGVCVGATTTCTSEGVWSKCEYGPDYEERETRCDGLDNDCDGWVDIPWRDQDPGAVIPPQLCALTQGVCEGTYSPSCLGLQGWEACGPEQYGEHYEELEATCDGLDNDCDGVTDEMADMTPPFCDNQRGVCLGKRFSVCQGELGWAPCGAEEYGSGYEEEEATCDGLDNDCDGEVDDPLVLMAPPCRLNQGVCQGTVSPQCQGEEGWAECDAAVYGPTYEEVEVTCDGLDNDCDGEVDEGLADNPPLCPLQEGVCLGSIRTACLGEAGWAPCLANSGYPGTYEPEERSCDGLDNDCDGSTDEVMHMERPACPLQAGTCAGSASPACLGAEGWAPCDAETYGAFYEEVETTCDGRDNDCDNLVDEDSDLFHPLCRKQEGVCLDSRASTCLGPAGWAECLEEYGDNYEPLETRCDGLDNDCDGTIDDPDDLAAHPTLCPRQGGVCSGSTHVTCNGSLGWEPCENTGSYPPTFEEVEVTCDGLDNDCDGETDEPESMTPPLCSLVVGVCRDSRSSSCLGIQGWALCGADEYGPLYEVTETLCDGLDNDCDSRFDENLGSALCELQEGVCAGKRTYDCQGEAGWAPCTALQYGAYYEAAETRCDGLDNDCDGDTDEMEHLSPPLCPSQLGVCEGSLASECQGEAGWAPCTSEDYGPDYEDVFETICDGLDNNCNGMADEPILIPDPCELQAGVCEGSVALSCLNEAGWAACGQAEYGPLYELLEARCDGIDNDCDGAIDEGENLVAPLCPLQEGVCQGSQASLCQGELGWATCSTEDYGPQYEELTETICDGQDNNCDGEVDEAATLVSVPCDLQLGVCEGSISSLCLGLEGWRACQQEDYGSSWESDQELTVDGLDNDCDGEVDEGCTGPNGQFVETESYGGLSQARMVVPGDLNNDKILDLVVLRAGASNTLTFLMGNGGEGRGDGTFTENPVSLSVPNGPRDLILADINQDGIIDMLVVSRLTPSLRVFMGLGNDGQPNGQYGETNIALPGSPTVMARGDINGDTIPDLVVANADNLLPEILILQAGGANGRGDGTFVQVNSLPTAASPRDVLLQDLNQDGILDLVVAESLAIEVALGQGAQGRGDGTFGPFSPFGPSRGVNSVSAMDVSGDSIIDLILATSSGIDFLPGLGVGGQGTGTFGGPLPISATGDEYADMVVRDLNGDALEDLVALNLTQESLELFVGEGQEGINNGGFHGPISLGPAMATAVASGDLNGDDRVDLAVASYVNGLVTILEAQGGTCIADGLLASGVALPGPADTLLSLTVADLNGDDIGDIVVGSAVLNRLFVTWGQGSNGRGDGTFGPWTDSLINTTFPPQALQAHDMNSDGLMDVIVGGPGGVQVLLGTGETGFPLLPPSMTDCTLISMGNMVIGDFNGDTIPDVAATDTLAGNVTICRGQGNGALSLISTVPLGENQPLGLTSGDFNGDAIPDLAAVTMGNRVLSLLTGQGSHGQADGTFLVTKTENLTAVPYGVMAGEINADHVLDLIIPSSGSTAILMGLGDDGQGMGMFHSLPSLPGGVENRMALSEDLDRDGILDILVLDSQSSQVALWHGNGTNGIGSATFSGPTAIPLGASSPRDAQLYDVNDDNISDLLVVCEGSTSVIILYGTGLIVP